MDLFGTDEVAKTGPDANHQTLIDPVAAARSEAIHLVVLRARASVRLGNAMASGMDAGKLPLKTVGEYLDAGSRASDMFMRALHNFGRTTARELDMLVHDYVAASSLRREGDASTIESSRRTSRSAAINDTRVVARLGNLTVADGLTGQVLSVRLATFVAKGLGARPLADVLTGGKRLRQELLRLPNFGQTTLNEFEALCREAVIRALAKDFVGRTTLLADCARLFRISTGEPDDGELARQIVDTLEREPPSDGELDQLIEWAMRVLPARELDILTKAYDLSGRGAVTLEKIAVDYSISYQRVRQLKFSALYRLGERLKGTALNRLVLEESDIFWTSRPVPYLLALPSEIEKVRRGLTSWLVLALDILALPLTSWLEHASTAMTHGYLARSLDPRTIRALGKRLQERLNTQPLPVAVCSVTSVTNATMIEAALHLETPFILFDSYVLRETPNARTKRAIRLHAMLCNIGRRSTLLELGELYQARFPKDRGCIRNLAIVLKLSPQMFVEIESGVWTALGPGGEVKSDCPHAVERAAPAGRDQNKVAGTIEAALRARGPSLINDLYRDGAAIVPPGRSRNSVMPIISQNPQKFCRILPGVYALPDQVLSPSEVLFLPLPELLTESQARIYAYARKAGEPWGLFPLWVPAAEYRLCDWARVNGSAAVYHSLLSIAKIDEWPVSGASKTKWIRRSARLGQFELVYPKTITSEGRPDLDRLLAASLVADTHGSIGWLQINRIMGRRLDAGGEQALLALMIALGAVTAPGSLPDGARLEPHVKTRNAAKIAGRISSELVRSGKVGWNSSLGRELAREAVSSDPAKLGWASADTLARLFGEGG